MRDYSKMPGYEGLTPLDARMQYARDLFRRYCIGYETGRPAKCSGCEFLSRMGQPKVCGWALDADPERAIEVLESLLGVPFEPEHDGPSAIKVLAAHNGLDTALDLLQEECAEVVQAVSKYRRYGEERTENLFEELADVSIVSDQIAELFPNGAGRIARWRDEKIGSTLKRFGLSAPETDRRDEDTPAGELRRVTRCVNCAYLSRGACPVPMYKSDTSFCSWGEDVNEKKEATVNA